MVDVSCSGQRGLLPTGDTHRGRGKCPSEFSARRTRVGSADRRDSSSPAERGPGGRALPPTACSEHEGTASGHLPTPGSSSSKLLGRRAS